VAQRTKKRENAGRKKEVEEGGEEINRNFNQKFFNLPGGRE